jgi:SRSO17 transposase
MERRFAVRLAELLGDAEVPPRLLQGMLPRLERFLQPFVEHLQMAQQRRNAHNYVAGLISNLAAKNAESIAYLHDRERQGLQKFIGQVPWAWTPLLAELARQVGEELGEADGVLVLDPSAFPKKGSESVGVQRQWCGRLGKIDNCQVGVYLAYVTRREHALVDLRLYLPESWASKKKRRRKAAVPDEVTFKTRHELALEMLDEKGPLLPHSWITGDDEMGRSTQFRRDLRARNERYLLCVPNNTLIRDLAAPPPPYRGKGPHAQVPFVRVDRWCARLPATAWTQVEIRAGEKGPLAVEVAQARVLARTERHDSAETETLVAIRTQQPDGTWKHDYLLSNTAAETSPSEFARVLNAEHRIEECLKRAKGEAGLADYEVRTWNGWHHHQTLSLIGTWFLTQEARRGKKTDPRHDVGADPLCHRNAVASRFAMRPPRTNLPQPSASTATERTSTLLPLEAT